MNQRACSKVFCALLWVAAGIAVADEPALERRVMLGTHVQAVSDAARVRLGLPNTRGVEVVETVPGTAAAAAGVRKGDVLLAVGDRDIGNLQRFLEIVGGLRGETQTFLRLNRDGAERKVEITLRELPRETSDEFEIEYGSVTTPAGRLRTVLTIPRGAQKARAVVLLSGLGNVPAEHPVADPQGFKVISAALTRAGYAVLRVDKPGCGDSEGGPARDVDFASVVNGYVAAVRSLKDQPRIDSQQIYLFGVSMGGLQAPLVAAREPVRGIVVFGTVARDWTGYLMETTRRQMQLSGVGEAEIEEVLANEKSGWSLLGKEGLAPDEIMSRYPDLTPWVEQNWADGSYYAGVTYRFFQQLLKEDVLAAWEKFEGPVLALWGTTDFVSSRSDHEALVKICNGKRPGQAEFQPLEGVDHSMREAATVEEAVRHAGQPGGQPSRVVVDAVAAWLKRLAS